MVEQVSSVSSVNCDIGPGLFGPIRGDKIGESPRVTPVQTLDPHSRVAAATKEATVENEKRSYKEVLLSPAKQVVVGRKKKRWKPTRGKMAHRNQEIVGKIATGEKIGRIRRGTGIREGMQLVEGCREASSTPQGHLLHPLFLDNLCSGSGNLPLLQHKVQGSHL
jgi:hypothetical protein